MMFRLPKIMLQPLFLLGLLTSILGLTACGSSSNEGHEQLAFEEQNDDEPPVSEQPPSTAPVVARSAIYSYSVQTDVEYAQALSHSTWNSEFSETISLTLDLYTPQNEFTQRPAFVFIHGGGFVSGSKTAGSAITMASYFAERGFVAMSINYRLLDDYGTLPSDILEAVDSLSDFEENDREQVKALYPAGRDAKAAIRWIHANAEQLGVDVNHITVAGGSAGAFITMGLGVTEPEDYRDELSVNEDPTLATTNLEANSNIHTLIDFWGGEGLVGLLEVVYGYENWGTNDVPVAIIHGTEDATVPFEQALSIKDRYETSGVLHEFYPLEGIGHGAWNSTVEGKPLTEVALDFVVASQELAIDD